MFEFPDEAKDIEGLKVELTHARKRYDELYHSSEIAFVSITPDFKVTDVNDSALKLLGGSLSSFSKSSFLRRIAPCDLKRFLATLAESQKFKRPQITDVIFRVRGLDSVEGKVTITCLYDSQGHIETYHLRIEDLRERIKQEQLQKDQNTRMLGFDRLALIGEMATNVAHAINNPLTVIVARSGELERKAAAAETIPAAEVLEAARGIQSTAFLVSKTISALLRLGKGPDYTWSVLPVHRLIEDAIDVCRRRFEIAGVQICAGAIPESIEVDGDRTQLVHVILHLLSNSLEAVEKLDVKRVNIELQQVDGFCVLSVADTGARPTAAVCGKMFEPFFSTKPLWSNTGLGLSISKTIVNDHGGTLNIDPLSATTRFLVQLPLSKGRPKILGGKSVV